MAISVLSSGLIVKLGQSTPAAFWSLPQPGVWIWEGPNHRAPRNMILTHNVERKSDPYCTVFIKAYLVVETLSELFFHGWALESSVCLFVCLLLLMVTGRVEPWAEKAEYVLNMKVFGSASVTELVMNPELKGWHSSFKWKVYLQITRPSLVHGSLCGVLGQNGSQASQI